MADEDELLDQDESTPDDNKNQAIDAGVSNTPQAIHVHTQPSTFISGSRNDSDQMGSDNTSSPQVSQPVAPAAQSQAITAPTVASAMPQAPETPQAIQTQPAAPAGTTGNEKVDKARDKIDAIQSQKDKIAAMPPGLARDRAEADFVKTSGSGIDQMRTKAQAIKNPLLRALAETGQGVLKGIETVGGVAYPGIAAAVPGTDIHHQMVQGQANQAIQTDLGNAKEQAETAETQARANALNNPKPKFEATGAFDANGLEIHVDSTKGANALPMVIGPNGYEPASTVKGQSGTAPATSNQAIAVGPPATGNSPQVGGGGGITTPPVNTKTATGGAQPGAFTGFGPKPAVVPVTEADKALTDYMQANNLPDTAAGREQARQAIFYQGHPSDAPIGAAADAKNAIIKNALKGSGIDAGLYAIDPKDSITAANAKQAEAEQALKDKRSTDTQLRVAGAPEVADKRKDTRLMGYAVDDNGKLIYTNKADADARHSTFEPITPADVVKDRQAIRQLNDVQQNVSRYTAAIKSVKGNIPSADVNSMTRILADKDLQSALTSGATLGALMSQVDQGEKADAWKSLSQPERDLITGYLRAKSSVIAYQKALTGIGRTNKETLEIEMSQLPSPIVGATVGLPQLDAFQENIDRATDGFPTNLPGLKTPAQIRKEVEGTTEQSGNKNPYGAIPRQ